MQKVSLLKCDHYENTLLKEKINTSLKNIDFDVTCMSNAKVLIKPNFLTAAKDDKAIMTHSEFFRAVVQIIKENGGTPYMVESPALQSVKTILKKTVYGDIVVEEGVIVADENKKKTMHYDQAKTYKQVDISEAFFDADVIVSLPKFKSHGITYITGAVKLFFGAIPGLGKSQMHFKVPDHGDFADFLLDLYGGIHYALPASKHLVHIMDAILVQEGEGPGPSGKPRKMNAILAGKNGVAVDYVATSVAGLNIKEAKTITKGFERNFDLSSPDEIQVIGDTVENLKIDDYLAAKGNNFFSNSFFWPFNTKTFKNLYVERPVPDEEKCTLCYQCLKICPAKAISKKEKKKNTPTYDYLKCIRCFCCMEICPEAAIEKQNGKFQWMLKAMDIFK